MLDRLVWPLYDERERRLRALVRIALHIGMLAPFALLAQWVMHGAHTASVNHPEGRFALPAAHLFLGLVVVGTVIFASRHLDRRPFERLGMRIDRAFVRDAAWGTALGALPIAAILGLEVALGLASFTARPPAEGSVPEWVYVPVGIAVFVVVALVEELVSRGYHLVNLAEGLESRWLERRLAYASAALVSSLVFGFLHASNPHADLTSTSQIVIAGLWLALAFLVTGRLGLPIGLHLGWNLAQNLFGMPVSGLTQYQYAGLLVRDDHGPAWITGGAFGPEAGLTGLGAMLLGILLVLAYSRVAYGRFMLRAGELAVGPLRASG